MRKMIAVAAVLALAACNNTKSDTDAPGATVTATGDTAENSDILEGDKPGFEAVAPGTYQITRSGGETDYIEIHPGMTFSRIAAGGAATGGSIFMKDGKTCFLVEGQEQEACFTDGQKQADGSMQTTSESGSVSTVKPVDGSLADHAEKSA